MKKLKGREQEKKKGDKMGKFKESRKKWNVEKTWREQKRKI